MNRRPSRRTFLKSLTAAGAAASLSPAWLKAAGANEKLNLASIGTGGKGQSDLKEITASPHVNVVALCDIDESRNHLGWAAEKWPHARQYSDWRRLLDKIKDIDAVHIATPDHMHAPVAMAAIQLGKPVYCQKPLTHTVLEARKLAEAAQKAGVVTQMGNQIQSNDYYRKAVRCVHDGVIGKVKEVYSWQSGPTRWPRGLDRPAGADPIPEAVNWDLWLGVAERPYKKEIYHPFAWRGWQDFSNGQLGDFGCHILDPVFMALELTAPTSFKADAPSNNKESWTKWATVWYEFPGTKYTQGSSIKVTWYDGDGIKPPHELLGVREGFELPKAGSLLIGEKGSLLIPHVAEPQLLPAEKFADYQFPELPERNHYVSWADACRGQDKTTSHFGYAGPLTEAVLLGTIAIRMPGEMFQWNSAELKIANSTEANRLLTKPYRKGWQIPGHFDVATA